MKEKRVIGLVSILISVFMLTSIMTACVVETGRSDSSGTTQTTTTTQPEQTQTETTQKKEVDIKNQKFTIMSYYDHPTAFMTFWGTNDPNHYTYWPLSQSQCVTYQKFVEEYNVEVETIVTPAAELYERLVAGEMAGQAVADLWTYHTSWWQNGNPLAAIKEGYFTPLDDYVDLDYPAFNPEYIPLYSYKGKTYGVAYRDSYLPPDLVCFANKMLLEEAGLDPAAIQDEALKGGFTWDKLKEYAEKIAKDTDGDGTNDILGFGILGGVDMEKFALTNGASPVKKQGNKYVSGLLDKEYLDAYNFLYDNAVAGIATLGGDAYSNFKENKQGFVISNIMQSTNQGWLESPGDNMMLLPPPKGPNADGYVNIMTYGVHAWYIPKSVPEERKPIVGKFLELYLNAFSGNLGEDPYGDHEKAVATYQRTDVWMTWSCRSVADTRVYHYLDTLPKINDFFTVIPGFADTIASIRGDIYGLAETPTVKLNSINDLWQKALDEYYGQ